MSMGGKGKKGGGKRKINKSNTGSNRSRVVGGVRKAAPRTRPTKLDF